MPDELPNRVYQVARCLTDPSHHVLLDSNSVSRSRADLGIGELAWKRCVDGAPEGATVAVSNKGYVLTINAELLGVADELQAEIVRKFVGRSNWKELGDDRAYFLAVAWHKAEAQGYSLEQLLHAAQTQIWGTTPYRRLKSQAPTISQEKRKILEELCNDGGKNKYGLALRTPDDLLNELVASELLAPMIGRSTNMEIVEFGECRWLTHSWTEEVVGYRITLSGVYMLRMLRCSPKVLQNAEACLRAAYFADLDEGYVEDVYEEDFGNDEEFGEKEEVEF